MPTNQPQFFTRFTLDWVEDPAFHEVPDISIVYCCMCSKPLRSFQAYRAELNGITHTYCQEACHTRNIQQQEQLICWPEDQ